MDELTGSHDEQLPLHGVGDRLRMARESKGMTIEQVAAETRIPQRHLEVIEAGDFDALPARTYATGFARTYAKAMGLDPSPIVEEVRAELARGSASADRGRVQTFEPGDPARVPSRGLALFSLIALVLLLVGGYMFYDRVLAPGSGPGSLIAEEDAARQAVAAPATPAASPTGGPVVFTALEEGVWVKFYDASGAQLMQKEMARGETYTVPADADGPLVWTGRPEALAITIGGRPVAKLSDEQRTMKDVPVTAAALLARNAPAAVPSAPATTAVAAPRATATTRAAAPRPAPTRRAAPASRPSPARNAGPAPRPTAQATVSNAVVQEIPGSSRDNAGDPQE